MELVIVLPTLKCLICQSRAKLLPELTVHIRNHSLRNALRQCLTDCKRDRFIDMQMNLCDNLEILQHADLARILPTFRKDLQLCR